MEVSQAQTCEDLLDLLGRFKSILFSIAESYGLTPMQLGTLHAIMRGEATMGAVARGLHCDASNVTGIIDRLVASELVTRQESTADRRAKTLQLTAKGQQTVDKIMSQLPAALGCAKLNATERAAFHAAIVKLAL
jgi:DNA-binding MarR family transcriptional regulator